MNEKGLPTLKICEQKFNYLNYSPRTKENYLSHISRFITSQTKSATHLNSKDFQSYLDKYQFTSVSQQNQVINSIRFLYKFGLNKNVLLFFLVQLSPKDYHTNLQKQQLFHNLQNLVL